MYGGRNWINKLATLNLPEYFLLHGVSFTLTHISCCLRGPGIVFRVVSLHMLISNKTILFYTKPYGAPEFFLQHSAHIPTQTLQTARVLLKYRNYWNIENVPGNWNKVKEASRYREHPDCGWCQKWSLSSLLLSPMMCVFCFVLLHRHTWAAVVRCVQCDVVWLSEK